MVPLLHTHARTNSVAKTHSNPTPWPPAIHSLKTNSLQKQNQAKLILLPPATHLCKLTLLPLATNTCIQNNSSCFPLLHTCAKTDSIASTANLCNTKCVTPCKKLIQHQFMQTNSFASATNQHGAPWNKLVQHPTHSKPKFILYHFILNQLCC